jgi:membrane fusion protein (multidrug efflux system)
MSEKGDYVTHDENDNFDGEDGSGGNNGGGGPRYGRIAIALALFCFCCFVVVKVSRPILLSVARYIVDLEKEDGDGFKVREVAVEVEEVKATAMPKYINTIGELSANKYVVLHPEMSGCVKEVVAKEGTHVKRGDVIIKLDDSQAQAELALRQAKFQLTEVELKRQKQMQSGGTGVGKDYDKAVAENGMAKAEVALATANLQKTEIRAPFDGVIGLIDVGVGAFVHQQQSQGLVTLVDQSLISVKFGVSGKYVNDVGVGQTVELRVESSKGKVFKGTVDAVDSHVDSATNNISLRALVPNEDGLLKAGLFADVMLVIGEQGDVMTVDESAIERIGEQEFVWVVDRRKARRVSVLTGGRHRGRVEVIGLKPGQVVVIAGQMRLSEGSPVRIIGQNKEDAGEKVIDDMVNEIDMMM